ncbi:MAG: 5-histidylcysteine sulfoxide synthase [Cyanobacteriota bacterium]|nr:5-histidylcysteine sulfoxide synthase [Cyanobacteriota bacterium]
MNHLKSQLPPQLNTCSQEAILSYFQNSWQLEDELMKTIVGAETFYINPDALRNPFIFYLGHSAVFYINKLIRVNLLDEGIHKDKETIFEIGVDPQTADELNAAIGHIQWPQLSEVWDYRHRAYEVISKLIQETPIDSPICQESPLWALMMGIEHQRIHFETSSMIIRQLPVEKVKRPEGWQYAPSNCHLSSNEMVEVAGGLVEIGKPQDSPFYGWDNEYGYRQVEVEPFLASQYTITNGEYRDFVSAGGYENPNFWDKESRRWRSEFKIQHPKFWIPVGDGYKYRAMFDEIELPLDWPVEVNHHEAMAYCRWQGEGMRLMSEAEWNLATYGTAKNDEARVELNPVEEYNLNLKFGSPSPAGLLRQTKSSSGLYDLRGNVWEWLGDDFNPLAGFQPHFLYEDNSTPFFDSQHKMMLGGAWATTGTQALQYYRNWFRPSFYQHAGFRIAKSL